MPGTSFHRAGAAWSDTGSPGGGAKMIKHTEIVYDAAATAFAARGVILQPFIELGGVGILVEKRMWSADMTYSGRADLILYDKGGKWAIIVDHKSGWLPVTVAADNWQLRTLAVLLRTKTGIDDILVASSSPTMDRPRWRDSTSRRSFWLNRPSGSSFGMP